MRVYYIHVLSEVYFMTKWTEGFFILMRPFFSNFRFFRKGNFCPVCLKIYGSDDELQSPMICCDICDRWIHTGKLDLKFYSH